MIRRGALKGRKTYVLALLAVATALAGWLVDTVSAEEAMKMAWAGGVAAALRHAVAGLE